MIEEELVARRNCDLRGIHLFWNMIDKRERKETYEPWNKVMRASRLHLLETRIPDTKRCEGHPQGPAEESPARLIESYRRVPCLSESVVLDIDEVVYERMDGLVQAIGREDVTTGSFVSRVISEHLERHADMIRIIEEQGQKRQ